MTRRHVPGGAILTLLLLLLAGLPARAGDPELAGMPPVKALVARAASASLPWLRTTAALRGRIGLADLASEDADVPLSVAAVLGVGREIDARDLRLLAGADLQAFLGALAPTEVKAGRRVPRHPFASLVHEEYVTDLAVQGDDRALQGGLEFCAPGVYRGSLGFTLRHEKAGWRVVELDLTHSHWTATWQDGRWRLRHGGPHADLPRVGTVGARPPAKASIVVTVTRDGSVHLPGVAKPLGLDDLRDHLARRAREPALRQPDGTSRLDVVLDVDAHAPWLLTQWLMQTCAHPRVKVHRIWLGAQTRDGQRGAIAVELPRDRGLAPPAPAAPTMPVRVKLFQMKDLETSSGLACLHAALDGLRKEGRFGPRVPVEIVAPPPRGGAVPHGFVLGVINVCLQAGTRRLAFEGAAMPLGPGGAAPDAKALRERVAALQGRPGSVGVKVGHEPSVLPPDAADAKPPAGRGLVPGRWGAEAPSDGEETLEAPVVHGNPRAAPGK